MTTLDIKQRKKKRVFDYELLIESVSEDKATLIGKYDHLIRDTLIHFKCNCGKDHSKRFNDIADRTGAFCKECSNKHKQEKRKETCLEKYGVEHSTQSKKVYNKIHSTMKERYGVEHALQSTKICEEMKEHNMEKYGVEHHMHLEAVKDKVAETCLEKYGSKSSLGNKDVRKIGIKTIKEKYGVEHIIHSKEIKDKMEKTCLERYGVKNVFESEEFQEKAKKTNLEKYGVSNPMQSEIIQEKSQKCSHTYKDYKTPSGIIRKVQGFEPFALDKLFKEMKFTEEDILTDRKDIPKIKYKIDGKISYYFPDIYIKSLNKIIEVKSTWTYERNKEKNIEKSKACSEAGYAFEFWIYLSKGKSLEIYKS
jgi:hypothetical protein